MIGEIIAAEYHTSTAFERKSIKCKVIVDGDETYTYFSLETLSGHLIGLNDAIIFGSNAIFLIAAICDLTWPTPEQLIGKLVPMCRNTFNGKTFWVFDWKQVRRMVNYWKKRRRDEQRAASTSNSR